MFIDYLVWTLRLGEINNAPFSKEGYEILGRAVRFMLRFCDPATGRMPNYGSNDGSVVLPLSSCDFLDFRPSLQAAYFLVHHEFYLGKGEWDEQCDWLFGPGLSQDAKKTGSSEVKTQPIEPRSGYLKLAGRESYAMVRAGEYLDRPSQADQLHFDLWWRGENIACDGHGQDGERCRIRGLARQANLRYSRKCSGIANLLFLTKPDPQFQAFVLQR